MPFLIFAAAMLQDVSAYEARRAPTDPAQLLAPEAPGWRFAQTVRFGPAPYRTRFRALWSGLGLHFRFDAEDDAPWFTMTARDDPLWEEEVVEIFRRFAVACGNRLRRG